MFSKYFSAKERLCSTFFSSQGRSTQTCSVCYCADSASEQFFLIQVFQGSLSQYLRHQIRKGVFVIYYSIV